MTEQELTEVLATNTYDEIGSHWDGCHYLHPRCAVHKLVAEVRRRRQEVDRLREALTWAVGFIRCQHPNAYLEYEDMRNAAALVHGDLAIWTGEFQRVSCRAEIAEYERDQLKKLLAQHGITIPEDVR